jgi:ABC-type transport system substrate-binding protein
MDEATRTASIWAAINSYAVDRRRFLQVAGITGAAATLAACTPTGGGAPNPTSTAGSGASNPEIPGPPWEGGVRGGRAVVLWEDPTLTYDPPLAYGQGDYYGLQNVYRGLIFYGPDAEPQLDVAESVDMSEDGLTYTFKIREGVNFHNGRAVTAEDFKWTFERSTSAEIGSWVQGFLGSVEGHAEFVDGSADEITGIVAEDERTLVLNLARPDVTILGVLGIPPFYVLPKEEVEKFGDSWPENPVGCGPFKLKSWDAGASTIVFERNEDYIWAADIPYFDEVEYRWNVGADVGYLQVAKNEADATYAVPASARPRIKQDAEQSKRYKEWSAFTLTYFEFDISKPPFDDLRVRQAVNHAFNKEKLTVLGTVPDGHFYPKGLLGYDESAPVYEYDPDKARALLEEAGATDISFTLPVFGEDTTVAQLLQQDLKDVGITIDLKSLSVNPYDIGFELPNQYRMWAMGWGMGLPDPSELFSSLIRTDAPSNFKKYSNPEIDELGEAAIGEADREKRGEMYAEIERLLLEDAPYLFIGVGSAPTFISEQLQNFYYEPILRTYYDRYWKNGE